MKLLTKLFIMERAGKWIATAGCALAAFGLVSTLDNPASRAGQASSVVGLVLLGFGIGMHLAMGEDDDVQVPEGTVQVLDALEEHETRS